jgi:tRNA 5-methylaminomethyl-2-thiouridine biosynthesis bifunctional protein
MLLYDADPVIVTIIAFGVVSAMTLLCSEPSVNTPLSGFLMHSEPIRPASWQGSDDGRIYAPEFGDIYASRSGAWGQANAVFIDGCDLPQRWRQLGCVRLLETGFGLGVNFLATWLRLRRENSGARLHYVAIEKHPFTRDDLNTALQLSIGSAPAEQTEQLRQLADALLAHWPPLFAGFHSVELDDQVTLTLVFGDVADVLPRISGHFDAFFLDGFAPDRNPQMWSPAVLNPLASLAAPGARLSSWCVAGVVRRTLADAGFQVGKRPGFGGKRDCLSASWPAHEAYQPPLPANVIVIGAGVAGASAARQLAKRGIAVTVLERAHPASGGSGNPVGIVRPEPGSVGNPVTEMTAAGSSWLRRWIANHPGAVRHDWCGVLRIARDARRHEKMAAQAELSPADWLRECSAQEAAVLCGATPTDRAFHLPQAGWVAPTTLVAALLAHSGIMLRQDATVATLDRVDAGWRITLNDGEILRAPLVVLATAFDQGLGPVRIATGRARGQLSSLPARQDYPLRTVVCRDGYIAPAVDGWHTVGATLQHDDEEAQARRSDDEQNFERLQRLLSGFCFEASALQSGRVGWRATTQDRVPLVGRVSEGLYASLGHGARGVTCAPLCAEFLAAMICDEPLPLGREWLARLDPVRRAVG